MAGAGPCAQSAGAGDRSERLSQQLQGLLGPSSAIVCVGNDLCGDDGAGPAVARALAGTVPWAVYDTQTAPESFLGKITAGRPESVIVVDALDFGAAAGSVRIAELAELAGQGPSTHGPAPLAFLEALTIIHPCRCAVVGIQPLRVEPGAEMSPAVLEAVRRVVAALRHLAQR